MTRLLKLPFVSPKVKNCLFDLARTQRAGPPPRPAQRREKRAWVQIFTLHVVSDQGERIDGKRGLKKDGRLSEGNRKQQDDR